MAEEEAMLLHVCCAPCFAAARSTLADAGGLFPTLAKAFFYNPNIHPLLEFRRRVKALRVYLERDSVPAEIDDEYGIAHFLRLVPWRGRSARERCAGCYRARLEKSAERCREAGLAGFTSTLLASREQDRDLVAEIGREAGKKFGVSFFEGDLRRVLPDEKMLRGIYKQQYCGCVFSEEERFRNTAKHLYHPEPKEE